MMRWDDPFITVDRGPIVEGPQVSESDVSDWRMQCQVFAAVSAQNGRSLTQKLQREPEAAELYFSEFVTETTEFKRIAQQIGEALDATALLFVEVVSELPSPLISEYNALLPEGVPVLVSSEKQQTKTGYVSCS
jgi:hypothetical protein